MCLRERADLKARSDAGKLSPKLQEMNELRGDCGFLYYLCNKVICTGGEVQGCFFGAESIQLVFVFENTNVWISCKRCIKYSEHHAKQVVLQSLFFSCSGGSVFTFIAQVSVFSELGESLILRGGAYKNNF